MTDRDQEAQALSVDLFVAERRAMIAMVKLMTGQATIEETSKELTICRLILESAGIPTGPLQ